MPDLLCSDCGAPGATVNEDAVFWLGRKAAEEEARCDNCNEAAYMREQERLMESGPPDYLRADKKYEGRP